MQKVEIRIEGMTCGGCVRAVENVLGRLPGPASVDVQVGRAVLTFGSAWDGRVEPALQAIERAGFAGTVERVTDV